MARQAGDIKITGSIEDLCFYEMEGEYYVRRKSSLSSRKFWKDPVFERSRKSCGRFALGSRLASVVYREVEASKRVYSFYRFLLKSAVGLLKEGKQEELVVEDLRSW